MQESALLGLKNVPSRASKFKKKKWEQEKNHFEQANLHLNSNMLLSGLSVIEGRSLQKPHVWILCPWLSLSRPLDGKDKKKKAFCV